MDFVRIIVLNYQTIDHTMNLIKCLEKQSYPFLEIVVVDNFSSAIEQEVLNKAIPKNMHLILSDINLGYAAGNNLGLRLQTGRTPDYHLILNSDIRIEDDCFVQKMLDGFKIASEKAIIAISPLVNTQSSSATVGYQIQVRKLLKPFTLIWLSFSLFKKLSPKLFGRFIYQKDQPYENKYLPCDTINGAAFMIQARFLQKQGYLDQGTFLFHEELILGKQIQEAGGICLLNGFVKVDHLQGVSTGSSKYQFNAKMERYKYQSEIYFYQKYCQVPAFILKLFGFLKELEIVAKKLMGIFK